MKIEGVSPAGKNMAVPASFFRKLAIVGTCDFTESEKKLFQAALVCVDKHLAVCPSPVPNFNINVILVDTESIVISIPDNKGPIGFTAGHHMEMIVYPVGLWRKAKLSDESVMFAMLEELSHAVWKISDEIAVKNRVEELLKYLNPNATAAAFLQKLTLESILYAAGIPGAQIVGKKDPL